MRHYCPIQFTVRISLLVCGGAELSARVWNRDALSSRDLLLTDRTIYECPIRCCEFPVRVLPDPYTLSLPLFLSLSFSRPHQQRDWSRIRSDQGTERTNPAGSTTRTAGPTRRTRLLAVRYTTMSPIRMRSSAPGEARRESRSRPTPRRYPSYRGIPRFVNIPPNRPFRRRESLASDAAVWLAGCTWP